MEQTIFSLVKDHQNEVRLFAIRESFCQKLNLLQKRDSGIVNQASLMLATHLIELGNSIKDRLQPSADTISQTIEIAQLVKKEAL